jgi:transposase
MGRDSRFIELEDRETAQLFAPSLRELAAEEPEVLAFDEVMEAVDVSQVDECYGSVGAPAYGPRMMLKVMVWAYVMGFRASRSLERACKMDNAFRFLAHGLKPDHVSFCRFRRRHAHQLGQVFEQTVKLCQQAGLVELGHVAVDGTKLRANRSSPTLRKLLAGAVQEAEAADAEIDPEAEAAQTLQEPAPDLEQECRFMKTQEGIKPAYNAQAAVDEQSQVIVAQQVSNDANDKGQLPEMVEQVEHNCGQAPEAVTADGGYYTQETVQQLEDKGVDLYMPTQARGRRDLEWDSQAEAFRCPAGELLRAYRVRRGRQVYRTHRCGGCPRQKQCGVKGRFREVHVPLAHTAVGRLERRMATDQGKDRYRTRKHTVEPVFGQAKHNRGFRWLLLRGVLGAMAEWSLTCIGHNVLKLVRARLCGAGAPVGAATAGAVGRLSCWKPLVWAYGPN